MRLIIVFLLGLMLFALPVAHSGHAQEVGTGEVVIDKKKLLVQPRNQPAVSFVEDPVLWLNEKQRAFYGAMSNSLRRLKAGSPWAAAWSLLLVSFLYGIFHAAGPGHGKVVVSAWIAANKSDLRRGLTIALLSALIQALSAILIVSILMIAFSNATALAKQSVEILNSLSFAMIAGVGLYLMWGAWKGHAHGHEHHHDHAHGDDHHNHDHGHMHVPPPQSLRGDVSFLEMLSLAFAVGIRPCSGAILVLVFAWTAGLYWAGILSTLAMGLGVFITVALIAVASVYAKAWALRFAATDSDRMERLARFLKFGGGAVIAVLGLLMLLGSLGANTGLT